MDERGCQVCEHGVLPQGGSYLEWSSSGGPDSEFSRVTLVGDTDLVPLIEARFEELVRCTWCGYPTVLRTGTGYWSREGWDQEADAEVLVYDDEYDTEGRQVAHVRLALGQWRQIDNLIVRV